MQSPRDGVGYRRDIISPNGLWLLAIFAAASILFGACSRLYQVDHKVLSDDEVVSIMHALGLTETDIRARAGDFHTVAELHAALHPKIPPRKLDAVITGLATEDPQHPPAYYLLEHWWFAAFGSSVGTARALPALIGVAALPCMFWLCLELFGSGRAAFAGTALFAVSPINVLYSQEIREYSLWVLTLLLTTALLLRALRSGSWRYWTLYAISLAASLYVHPLSAFVALAHAIVLVFASTSKSNRWLGLGALTAACLAYVPWLIVVFVGRHQIQHVWATVYLAKDSPLTVIRNVIHLLGVNLLDLNGQMRGFVRLAAIPAVLLVAYAVCTLRAGISRLLLWSLLLCSTLPLIVPDLLSGGARTATIRYFMPLFLAIDLALTALICSQLLEAPSSRRRAAWMAGLAVLFAMRIWSIEAGTQARTWWTKYNMQSFAVADVVNKSPYPILISDDYIEWTLALGEYLDDGVHLALSPRCYMCSSTEVARVDLSSLAQLGAHPTVFLLGPSQALQDAVKAVVARDPPNYSYHCIHVRDDCKESLSLF